MQMRVAPNRARHLMSVTLCALFLSPVTFAQPGGGPSGPRASGAALPAPPYPPLEWVAQEQRFTHPNADDQGVDIVYWHEELIGPDNDWIYVTGWVTEMDGETVLGTRIATYRYPAAHVGPTPPAPDKMAFYPPELPMLSPGDEFKAAAMTIDPFNGDIYVAGTGPRLETGPTDDLNYVIIRYTKDLTPVWPNDARFYDGPISDDDIAVDVGIDQEATVVVVTGTSPGPSDPYNTNLDIATVAWNTSDGSSAHTLWPDVGWLPGVRRYDYDDPYGDDLAVELGGIHIATFEDEPQLNVVVLGTSWGGNDTRWDYTTHWWSGPGPDVQWEIAFNLPGDDIARGMWIEGPYIFVTGYSESPTTSEIEFSTSCYHFHREPEAIWLNERWGHVGDGAYPNDIRAYRDASGIVHLWLTGAVISGSRTDAALAHYSQVAEVPTLDVTEAWSLGHDFAYGRALALLQDEPYVVGGLGTSTFDSMLALKYFNDSGTYTEDWYRTFKDNGPFTGGSQPDHEGRAVVVAPVDVGSGAPSVFVTGVSSVSGAGRQFTTWRYKEE